MAAAVCDRRRVADGNASEIAQYNNEDAHIAYTLRSKSKYVKIDQMMYKSKPGSASSSVDRHEQAAGILVLFPIRDMDSRQGDRDLL